jgi:hypothetical protein
LSFAVASRTRALPKPWRIEVFRQPVKAMP